MMKIKESQTALEEAMKINAEYQRLKQFIRDLKEYVENQRNIYEDSQDDRRFGRYEGYFDVRQEMEAILEKYQIKGL